MERKPKLSVPQQIQHMENAGVTFSYISKADASRFLQYNTYYFKLKAYAKNFTKYKEGERAGKYFNLDFAYLQDLSTIDAHLRKFIIKTALDIEHFLKVKLLQDFGLYQEEDGYGIVEDFFKIYPAIRDNVIGKEKNSNCVELIEKYKDDFAIWNVIEVLSFGDFIPLYDLFYRRYESRDNFSQMLMPIKWLRNAAAHNNCLINKMGEPYARKIEPVRIITKFVSEVPELSSTTRAKKMTNPVIHDFVTMLYVATRVVSSRPTLKKMFEDLDSLINNRMVRHREYYEKNQMLQSNYKFVKKVVDFLASQSI